MQQLHAAVLQQLHAAVILIIFLSNSQPPTGICDYSLLTFLMLLHDCSQPKIARISFNHKGKREIISIPQGWCSGKFVFETFKSRLTLGSPRALKHLSCLDGTCLSKAHIHYIMQRPSYLGEPFDESSAIATETQERSELLESTRDWPLPNCIYLIRVCTHALG